MPRAPQGGAYQIRDRFFARVTISAGQRKAIALPWATTLAQAEERARAIQDLVTSLVKARQGDFVLKVVEVGSTDDPARWADLVASVGRIVAGKVPIPPKARPPLAHTFRGVAEKWNDGELHALYPDHVREKRSADDDAYRLGILYETSIASVPVADVTLEHCEAAMREVETVRTRRAGEKGVRRLGPGGRRQYAQLISRVLSLAVYPLRLMTASPIPKGWLPRVPTKAKSIPYPDEEAALLGDTSHPIHWRVFFGALARLGLRADEAASLTMASVDVERGIVTLDENKTDDPRAPSYGPEVMLALAWWKRTYRADAEPDDRFFVQPNGAAIRVDGLAERFRSAYQVSLRRADRYRPELFERTATRLAVRVHDCRGMFVTYALASGRTETWVADRTGHRSSTMINRYRRVARTVLEAQLGDLLPLHDAIPEIAAASTAAEAAARPNSVDQEQHPTYRNNVTFGPIAQSVELRTFNP